MHDIFKSSWFTVEYLQVLAQLKYFSRQFSQWAEADWIVEFLSCSRPLKVGYFTTSNLITSGLITSNLITSNLNRSKVTFFDIPTLFKTKILLTIYRNKISNFWLKQIEHYNPLFFWKNWFWKYFIFMSRTAVCLKYCFRKKK